MKVTCIRDFISFPFSNFTPRQFTLKGKSSVSVTLVSADPNQKPPDSLSFSVFIDNVELPNIKVLSLEVLVAIET